MFSGSSKAGVGVEDGGEGMGWIALLASSGQALRSHHCQQGAEQGDCREDEEHVYDC